jgi:diadenosine tetraphosphate (Ap4A) HIT family hydrolase
MKWTSPDEWARLKAGKGCPLCADQDAAENDFSFLVADLGQSVVRLPRNQHLRGWTTVVFRRHASELFELSPQELAGFWADVSRVARALYRVHRPAKINYCVWGNITPHVHCHLFVRRFDDDPGQPIDQNAKEVFLKPDEYQAMIGQLKEHLKTPE